MTRYLLMLAALLFSVPYAEADSIVDVQGAPVAGGLAISPAQSLSETWTQTGSYTNETVSGWLFSGYVNGQPATSVVTAWLTGGGISLSGTFDLSSPFATLVPLFTMGALGPGSYTLTITSAGGYAGWVWGPETGQPVNVVLADGSTVTMIGGVPLSFVVTGMPVGESAGVPVSAGAVADPIETDEPDTIVLVVAAVGLGIALVGMVMLFRSIIRSYKDAFEKDDWED